MNDSDTSATQSAQTGNSVDNIAERRRQVGVRPQQFQLRCRRSHETKRGDAGVLEIDIAPKLEGVDIRTDL